MPVTATFKLVLRDMPETRERGGMVYMALHNEPKGLPKGVTLDAGPLYRTAPVKQWKTACTKAEQTRAQGTPALMIVETHVSTKEGALRGVVTGVQVMEGKTPAPNQVSGRDTPHTCPTTTTARRRHDAAGRKDTLMRHGGRVLLLSTVLALTGCIPAAPLHTPDGRYGYSIDCSMEIFSWARCFEKASQLCGAAGYTLVPRSDCVSPTRTLVIACKGACPHEVPGVVCPAGP